MIFGDLRRSENIEDRRRRRVAPEISQGVFSAGQPVPNVFDTSEGLLTGLGPDDFANEPIGPLSREAGVDDVARSPEPVVPAEPARWAMGALAAQDQYNPEEGHFQTGIRATPWFSEFKQKYGEEPNLNDPDYDYRAAWRAGARPDVRDPGDQLLHWPSQFKGEHHPNRFVDGVDTTTGEPIGAYRGIPRLDPGIRRAPGDVVMRPAAETVGQVVGDLVIPQDPLDYAAMFALGPAGKMASKGVRAGALAMGGVLGLSDEAEASKLKAIKQGIKAYHSSPHDFEKFDASKIGTGEGAQVYGHGLYFAENPKVSGQGGEYWNQFLNRFEGPEREIAERLRASNFDRKAAAGDVDEQLAWLEYNAKHANSPEAAARNAKLFSETQDALRRLESGQPVGPRTYEVNIRADPAQMLDWDKPLSQQSEHVRAAIPDIVKSEEMYRARYPHSPMADPFGSNIYSKVGATGGLRIPEAKAQASEFLREAGIPGIKYLDQGSRVTNPDAERIIAAQGSREAALELAEKRLKSASTGDLRYWDNIVKQLQPETSNYVVFDPNIVDILKKYGIAGAAAPMGALAAQDEYR